MRPRKSAPPLGVFISVCHPASEVPPHLSHPQTGSVRTEDGRLLKISDFVEEFEADEDGHTYSWGVEVLRGAAIVNVSFVRGIALGTAAQILRKLATIIENNPALLGAKQGVDGFIIHGKMTEFLPGLELYDDLGNPLKSPRLCPKQEKKDP